MEGEEAERTVRMMAPVGKRGRGAKKRKWTQDPREGDRQE